MGASHSYYGRTRSSNAKGEQGVRFSEEKTIVATTAPRATTAASPPLVSPRCALDATMTDACSASAPLQFGSAPSSRGLRVEVLPSGGTSTFSDSFPQHSSSPNSSSNGTDSTSPDSDFSGAWDDDDEVHPDLSGRMDVDGDKSTGVSPLRKKYRGKSLSLSSSAANSKAKSVSLMSPDAVSAPVLTSSETGSVTPTVFPSLRDAPAIKPASSFVVSSLVTASTLVGLPSFLLPAPATTPPLLSVRRKSPRSGIANAATPASAASAAQAAPLPPQDLPSPCNATDSRFPLSASPAFSEAPVVTTFSPGAPPSQIPVKTVVLNGKLVYVVSEKYKTFVFNVLSPEECENMIVAAEAHVAAKNPVAKGSGVSSWRKLYTYTEADLPMQDVRSFETLQTSIMKSICEVIGAYYNCDASMLHPRTWKEPHLLKYTCEGSKPHCGVEMHYDGCDVTWNLMLSRDTDYEGGGTYVRCLKRTVKLTQGQVLVHPGDLFHKGVNITSGMRYLIVCFTDGHDPDVADDSTSDDKTAEHEKNVVMYSGGSGKEN